MYNYCPKCGGKYSKAEIRKFSTNKNSISCLKCSFVFYNNPKPCSVAIIINGDNKILLTKRAVAPFKDWWDLPGGFIKYGENPEKSLVREIKEELGVNGKVKNLVGTFNEFYNNLGKIDQKYSVVVFVYRMELKADDPMPNDDIADYKYFSINNLPSKIAFSGKRKFLKGYFKGFNNCHLNYSRLQY